MRKTLLFTALLLLLSPLAALNGQVTKYFSKYVAVTTMDESGEWAEWSDWVEEEVEFEVDSEEDFITVSDDQGELLFMIMSVSNKTDEEGDKITSFECMDENFSELIIVIIDRLSFEEKRTEIYMQNDEKMVVYIVEKSSL